ncbi:hypothetical protein LSH36_383g00000 [Paralvinella palmiformis]|uniref:non-specific serine/threonine protein kinase n=1 Tax=Paralvinella palmiformis TaxID=53620 RepID=A0AAD9N0U9_9ANNE|nr:hypothetical protein LSH36_383g00000 [Paralvinella palmiformis]
MDNYKIIQKLGKGAQGSALLVENKANGTRVVLKKIECNDENDANKAFKEALALKKLEHDCICVFKEMFVHWDKELSAMFMCIVMDYYTKGDLSSVIKKNRELSQPIDEQIIKTWLGQILQALMYIHNNGIIHRDLKPSNVFIQEDGSIVIGDFGVSTVMVDVLTRTRSTVGTLNYVAPEVLEQRHNEKSDIWSLGCVILELATCQHTELSEMAGLLNKIKHDEQALDDILQKVQATYSNDLVSVIRNMLGKNFRQRPSPIELSQNPYVQQCLEFSEAILLVKQKHLRSGSRSIRPVPTDKDPKALMEYMTDNLGDEAALTKGLEQLVEITKDDGTTVNDDGKHVIGKIMNDYIVNEDIQTYSCQVLCNLAMTVTADDILYTSEIIDVMLKAAETHPKCGALQQAVANLVMALSADGSLRVELKPVMFCLSQGRLRGLAVACWTTDHYHPCSNPGVGIAEEKATELMGDMRAVEIVLAALRHYMRDESICTSCLTALWSLAVNEDNVRTLTQNGGVYIVVDAIKGHLDNPELLESAFAVLLSLSIEDENITNMNSMNCVGLLIDAIQEHMVEPKLVKNACITLAAMVEADEESAFRVLSNNKDNQPDIAGIPIILKAYSIHKDNAEVVENICILLMELLEYDLVCSELYDSNLHKVLLEVKFKFLSYKPSLSACRFNLLDEIKAEIMHMRVKDEILIPIHRRFKENQDIMQPCEKALEKLGVKNPPLHD